MSRIYHSLFDYTPENLFDIVRNASIRGNSLLRIPTDIVKFDDENYEIRLAVSGRNPSDFAVEQDNRVVTIKCDTAKEKVESDDDKHPVYLSSGIMKSAFSMKIMLDELDEYLYVDSVTYKDGILTVKIKKELPENLKPKVFKIEDQR